MVRFMLGGRPRVGEPHDYGVTKGTPKLFFWQTQGESQSGKLPGWRWAELGKMSQLEILDKRFAGPRPAERHNKWDRLFASVARPA